MQDAQAKADNVGARYFFTWNVNLNARQQAARRHVKVPEALFGEIALRIAI